MSSKFKAGDFPQFNEKIQYEMVEALNKKLKKQIKKYKNRSCANCKRVDKCKLANDVVNNFGTKLKEQYFYCWESK